jgi:ClpP class serine protease
MEMSKEGFLEAVITQRGKRLKADRQTLSRGEIYIGMGALGLGLIDSIDSTSGAVEKAASQAGLRDYQVVEIGRISPLDLLMEDAGMNRTGQLLGSKLPPGIYYLYLDPRKGL